MKSTSPRKRLAVRIPLLQAFIVVLALLLTGCASGAAQEAAKAPTPAMDMAMDVELPQEVQSAAVTVRGAYEFALTNPDALKNVPCYCGCGTAGHTSNYSCYVKEVQPSGEVIFDQHALGCSICVDITQDVMKMTLAGKTPLEIRTTIDQTYSQYGPSNMPPLQ